ncbi:MAG: zf-HC2 domain-containing protein [Planctomycetota bacterium]
MNGDCDSIRPLVFAAVEDGLADEERAAVAAHLARCAPCRREMEAERALTRLLRRRAAGGAAIPRRRAWRRPAAAALVLGLGLAAVLSVLGGQPAYGSATPCTLTLGMRIEGGPAAPLLARNHLDVPRREVLTLRVRGLGALFVAGPAVLDLDRTADGWKTALLAGRLQATIDDGARLVVTSVFGERVLGAGMQVVSLDPASFASDGAEAADEPVELFHAGLDLFFVAEDPAGAEPLLRAALAAAESAGDRTLASDARFYLAAALGRQERWAAAVEVQEEWLRLSPGDGARHYVLFFQGRYLERLGRAAEARECWRTIEREDPASPLLESLPAGARSGAEE